MAGPPGPIGPGHPRAARPAAIPPAAPPSTSTTAATNPASSKADARTPRREAPTERRTASSGARSEARAAESVSMVSAAAARAAAAVPSRSRNNCVRAASCPAAGVRASGFQASRDRLPARWRTRAVYSRRRESRARSPGAARSGSRFRSRRVTVRCLGTSEAPRAPEKPPGSVFPVYASWSRSLPLVELRWSRRSVTERTAALAASAGE
jgi:hypothetical protein